MYISSYEGFEKKSRQKLGDRFCSTAGGADDRSGQISIGLRDDGEIRLAITNKLRQHNSGYRTAFLGTLKIAIGGGRV